MKTQERFEKLQEQWRKEYEKASDFAFKLSYKYGNTWRAPAGMQKKLDSLRSRESRAQESIFSWLDEHSPRNFRSGCPYMWVCDKLTYADAITYGRLSVTPPCCYGSYPSDMLRFAAPVEPAFSVDCGTRAPLNVQD